MTITSAMERDPAFRCASWLVKVIYPQLRGQRRIEAMPGADLVDTLCFRLKGLSATPREDVARALDEMRQRGLLIELEGGALEPKHAPRPKVELPPAARSSGATGVGAGAGGAVPEDADARIRRGFSAHLSRNHRDHPARKDDKLWPVVQQQLWEAYVARFEARPERRRAADAVTAAVAPAATADPSAPAAGVTGPGVVIDRTVTVSVPAVSEEVGGEKNSLSPSEEGEGKETFQPPREAGPAVTGSVTAGDVTAGVTDPAPTGGAPTLTASQLRHALRATDNRVGSSGRADRARMLAILQEEDFTLDELRAFAKLARARQLYLQDTHPRVSLGFLLQHEAKILHRWIDDVRAELAKQPALGFAANDPRTGATQAAPRATAPPAAAPTGAPPGPGPSKTIAQMTPEERAANLRAMREGVGRKQVG